MNGLDGPLGSSSLGSDLGYLVRREPAPLRAVRPEPAVLREPEQRQPTSLFSSDLASLHADSDGFVWDKAINAYRNVDRLEAYKLIIGGIEYDKPPPF